MLDERIASPLSELLDSPLWIEVEKFEFTKSSFFMNLTRVASQIQTTLNELDSASTDELAFPRVIEEGDLRVVWHARPPRGGGTRASHHLLAVIPEHWPRRVPRRLGALLFPGG